MKTGDSTQFPELGAAGWTSDGVPLFQLVAMAWPATTRFL